MGLCQSRLCGDERGFPIADIPLHLQEKIITKFDSSSYLRLYRTCKYLMQVIQKSPYINVYVDGNYCMIWLKKKDGTVQLCCYKPWGAPYLTPYAESWGVDENRRLKLGPSKWMLSPTDLPYGIRFKSFSIPADIHTQFERYRALFNSHRLTSKGITTPFFGTATWGGKYCGEDATHEEFVELMEMLKPKRILELCDDGSNRYEVLFQFKDFEEIHISGLQIKTAELIPVIGKLLALTKELSLFMNPREVKFRANDLFGVLTKILQWLNSETYPDLQRLDIYCRTRSVRKTKADRARKIFQDYSPTVITDPDGSLGIMFALNNRQSYCKVSLDYDSISLDYEKTVAPGEDWKSRQRRLLLESYE